MTIEEDHAPQIQIIDDDLTVQIAMQDHLEEKGFRVRASSDGESGLRDFEACHSDLVLLDVSMPGIDGFETCRRLREFSFGKHIPIVMMTGHDDVDSIDRAYESGATDFVSKPISFVLLAHRLRYLLRSKQLGDKLRQSEASLANAQRMARLGSWSCDLATGTIKISDQVREMMGVTDQVPTTLKEFIACISHKHRSIFRSKFKTAVSEGEPYQVDFSVPMPDGTENWFHQEACLIPDDAGDVVQVLATIQDVSQQYEAQRRIRELAYYDHVTGLPNRTFFLDRLRTVIQEASHRDRCMAVMFIDLDGFKRVNDSYGHQSGDNLLRNVARRLNDSLRSCDLVARFNGEEKRSVARIGGDEFVVILSDLRSCDEAGVIAQRLLANLRRPFMVESTEVVISGSIGISTFPEDGPDAQSLLRNADMAMYDVKERGRNGFRFFEERMNTRLLERLSLEASLRHAVEESEFKLHYQPILAGPDERLIGAEALLRWEHRDLGYISPAEFVPVAEECGLIEPIGKWVIREACRQAAEWQRVMSDGFFVSINISVAQFAQGSFVDVVRDTLASTGLDPRLIHLELTESVLMEDTAARLEMLHKLKEVGVSISIDDFGTGFSSLNYLRRLPIDTIKIDRSFIMGIGDDDKDTAIVQGTIGLAHSLGLSVVAEGVEDPLQRDRLILLSCDAFQGYFYSPAVHPDEFVQWAEQRGFTASAAHPTF